MEFFKLIVILISVFKLIKCDECPMVEHCNCTSEYNGFSSECADNRSQITFRVYYHFVLQVDCGNMAADIASTYNLLPYLNETFLYDHVHFYINRCPLPKSFSVFTSKFPTIKTVELKDFLGTENINEDFFEVNSPISSISSTFPNLELLLTRNMFKNIKQLERVDLQFVSAEQTMPWLEQFFQSKPLIRKCQLVIGGGGIIYLDASIFEKNINLEELELDISSGSFSLSDYFLANKPKLKIASLSFSGPNEFTPPFVVGNMFENSTNLKEISLINFNIEILNL